MVFIVKVITARVPDVFIRDLEHIEVAEQADRAEVVRRLLGKAITEWKSREAVEKLREHKISYRKAAKLAGVSYVEMLDLAVESGVDSGYSLQELNADLRRI
jgi:predicted HTH domain antitoxin